MRVFKDLIDGMPDQLGLVAPFSFLGPFALCVSKSATAKAQEAQCFMAETYLIPDFDAWSGCESVQNELAELV